MTAPVAPAQEGALEGRTEVSIQELERIAQGGGAPDLSKIEVKGVDLGTFKGTTAAELVAHAKVLEESLRTSERSRLQAEQLAAVAARQPAPVAAAPVAPAEPKMMTDEEIQRIYEENPLQAIKLMTERAATIAQQSLAARLEPLVTSSSASAEQMAREKYKEEFALFGDQIKDVISKVPNSRVAMANPAAWDDLMSYVRGQPGNFEKIIETRAAKQSVVAAEAARTTQVASIGFSPAPTGRHAITKSDGSPDPVAAEIADKLGMTWDEYVKWSKVG